jgi:hypothetical protein
MNLHKIMKIDLIRTKINIQQKLSSLYVHCLMMREGLARRLSVLLYRHFGIFIYSWMNWFAIYTVYIYRNANMIAISIPS